MVIDDNDLLRSLVRMHLQALGHEVLLCEDGAVAIRMLFAERPDLVLLDLGMPFIDGFELLRALKGDPLTRHIAVVVMTSFGDPSTQDRVRELGASEFLTKPVTKEMLAEVVAKHLRSDGAPQACAD